GEGAVLRLPACGDLIHEPGVTFCQLPDEPAWPQGGPSPVHEAARRQVVAGGLAERPRGLLPLTPGQPTGQPQGHLDLLDRPRLAAGLIVAACRVVGLA